MPTRLHFTTLGERTWLQIYIDVLCILTEWISGCWMNKQECFPHTFGLQWNIHPVSHGSSHRSDMIFMKVLSDKSEGLIPELTRARSVQNRQHLIQLWFQILYAMLSPLWIWKLIDSLAQSMLMILRKVKLSLDWIQEECVSCLAVSDSLWTHRL